MSLFEKLKKNVELIKSTQEYTKKAKQRELQLQHEAFEMSQSPWFSEYERAFDEGKKIKAILDEMANLKMISQEKKNEIEDMLFYEYSTTHQGPPAYDFVFALLDDINNPAYKIAELELYQRNDDCAIVINVMKRAPKYFHKVTYRKSIFYLCNDWKQALLIAKNIIETEKEQDKKELESFKEEHKKDFELFEAIKQAQKVVNSDWHNLNHVVSIKNFNNDALLNRIDKQMEGFKE